MREFYVPAGSGSPPHVHQREDEAFYVVDDEFEFTVAGEPVRVAVGGFLLGRRGVPHNFKNIGATPGRMVVTVCALCRNSSRCIVSFSPGTSVQSGFSQSMFEQENVVVVVVD